MFSITRAKVIRFTAKQLFTHRCFHAVQNIINNYTLIQHFIKPQNNQKERLMRK